MADEKKNALEGIVENTPKKEAYEVSLGGFKLKLNNTMIAMAIPLFSALGGSLWGAFEFYQDYMDMKAKIKKYVAPDLSEFHKRLAIIEETSAKNMTAIQDNSAKTADYTRDIKNDLKQDIRRLEGVVEGVERSSKQNARDAEVAVREVQQDMRKTARETEQTIKQVQREVDVKIKQALDNPLAGK